MKTFTLTLVFFFISNVIFAQVINGYAEVTNLSGNVLTIGTVDESADSFEDGEWLVLMQMQDDVIGDVSNSASFGDLGTINSVGRYEIRQIVSHTETAGVPATITLDIVPNFTYNTCANCSIQIISFPVLGAPNYTTTAPMSALDWDGTIGGVLAFSCPGTLTLEHNLTADAAGFRGGATNGGGSAGCSGGANYRVISQANYADKGEGIYKVSDPTYAAAMGKILNGGGGGNSHNGGGGGGGNYSVGGDGGPGWPNCLPSAGGNGGISLQSDIDVARVFLGGGGGSGEGNNGVSTNGGDGGGIILIKAEEIQTAACTGVTISANGQSIAIAGNDGGGGGGAGGSIVIETNTWNISGACPLVFESIGGNGGSVSSGATHGGGGGGGQGVVIFSTAEPLTNVTTTTAPGTGGCNNSSDPCNSIAGSGGGVDGDGVIELLTGPLPIELIDVSLECLDESIIISWITKSETNSDLFVIQRSRDAENWTDLGTVPAAGNSNNELNYSFIDQNPIDYTYYRLIEVDLDGEYEIVAQMSSFQCQGQINLFPNPSQGIVNINLSDSYQIVVLNSLGQEIYPIISQNNSGIQMDFSHLPNGNYFIKIHHQSGTEVFKLILIPD